MAIQLEEGWSKIQKNGIAKIQKIIDNEMHGKISNQEFADLYTIVYTMCIQKEPFCHTSELYERFSQSVRDYLETTALPAILSDNKHGEYLLLALKKQWEDYRLLKRWLINFFVYLNRFYVKRTHKRSLEDVCLNNFRVLVFDKIKRFAADAMLVTIENDRDGELVDRSLLRNIIQIFVEMGMGKLTIYSQDFEQRFLSETLEYYSRKAAIWLASDTCPEYLRKAERAIQSEISLLTDSLHPSSKDRLMKVLIKYLLLQHQTEILGKPNTGFLRMLQTDAREDLARIYSLYKEIPQSLIPIGKMLKDHIIEVGQKIVHQTDEKDNPLKFVEEMMQLHTKYFSLVHDLFENSPIFDKALKEASETILNQKLAIKRTPAELIATYCNSLLSKDGIRTETEAILEETLDKIVRIFSYLCDKDLFLEFYRKLLAKRLLMARSANEDAEKSMIGKLKIRCGAQFTSKLEGMINDMKSASEHRNMFTQFLAETHADELSIDLDVQVLTTTYWPTYKESEIQLDQSMIHARDLFQKYYDKRTSNRRLKWIHVLGMVTLSADFPNKRVFLEVSTIQACVLLLLNTCESMSILNLHKVLKVPLEELKRQLKPLVNKRFKILNKTPPGGYDVSHLISINMQCNPSRKRIRIPLVASVSNHDRAKNIAEVQENRKHAIEASIVRVMKSRRTLEHAQLIAEVSAQLMPHFKPDPRAIKSRVEDLIGREYLERHPGQPNAYNYLA
uniref:Cullin-1-like isoform 1 n=1 Tax=Hirondellea gigas TaxID=1518452 RepID=A0A6A7G4K3_9CRUS